MYDVKIKRDDFQKHPDKQTLGQLEVIFKGKCMFKCKTLELPWKDNKFQVSCIPTGTYKVVRRNSAKYGDHFYITNVPNRDMVLIHHGNYHWDILGCILVGVAHKDINGDGLRDVTSSKPTMKELNKILPSSFQLVIE